MTIKTILFDVGGVIVAPLDPQRVRRQRQLLAEELGMSSGEEMWLHFYESPSWEAAKTGRARHVQMWDELLRPFGYGDRAAQADFVMRLHAGQGLLPGMERLLATLAQRYKMGILSNWDDTLEMILDDWLAVDHYFDAILNSHRIGVAKPDAAAFRTALAQLDAVADEVLFIDDLERNVAAAAALGMHTHHFLGLPALISNLQQHALLPNTFALDGQPEDGSGPRPSGQ
jgi:putative hydrolase of the HAD superfamily